MEMAKGLNINAVPFEPGVVSTTPFCGYIHGPPLPLNPNVYIRPMHPYEGAVYQYNGPDLHSVQTMPMYYYAPNYAVLPPGHWQSVQPAPRLSLPPPPPLLPTHPPAAQLVPPSRYSRPANLGLAGTSHYRTRCRNTALKVLTGASSSAVDAAAAVAAPASDIKNVSVDTQTKKSTEPVENVPKNSATEKSATPSQSSQQSYNKQPSLLSVAKATVGFTKTPQLTSAEDFPALGSGETLKNSAKVANDALQREANISAVLSGPTPSKPSILSYSAVIKQAPRLPAPPVTAVNASALQSDKLRQGGTAGQNSSEAVAAVGVENSRTVVVENEQKKKRRSRRRPASKKKKNRKSANSKQASGVTGDSEQQQHQQQPVFQLEQEDFPSLGLRVDSSTVVKSAVPPPPPPLLTQQQTQPPSAGRRSDAKPQSTKPPTLLTVTSSVSRKQQLNRAARQSLLLSSSLLVVNRAIVVSNQKTSSATSSGAAGAAKPASIGGVVGSVAPIRIGKQRERPRAKKKSLTKKIILMERQARRKAAEAVPASSAVVPVAAVDIVQQEDFANKAADDNPPEAAVESTAPNPPSPTPAAPSKQSSLHSRRFREYCDQLIMKSVQELSAKVLRDLLFFQARARARDPTKAKQKRRLVMGLREARKHIGLNRIRLVFISPDLERVQAPGGLDDSVNQLIGLCQQRQVPYVFGLKRREMGRVLRKTVPVSVVAVFDYQGCETNVNALLELVRKAKDDYQTLSQVAVECAQIDSDAAKPVDQPNNQEGQQQQQQQQQRPPINHSRNPSDTSNAISEPISDVDASASSSGLTAAAAAAAAAAGAAAAAAAGSSSQLYGFHSRQSSLGVVVIAQAIEEVGDCLDVAPSSSEANVDKVANWLAARDAS